MAVVRLRENRSRLATSFHSLCLVQALGVSTAAPKGVLEKQHKAEALACVAVFWEVACEESTLKVREECVFSDEDKLRTAGQSPKARRSPQRGKAKKSE
eukprot:1187211-Pleurochrysis_carterae.AAC.2